MSAIPLPAGFRVILAATTVRVGEDAWLGRRPLWLTRLTGRGRAAWQELGRGPVTSRAAGLLARRLTDAGLYVAVPPPVRAAAEVTVIVPTKERAAMLTRCLAGQADRYRVIVVDDGSEDRDAIRAVAESHGAELVRRPVNGGPAAARNTGLAAAHTEFVAFLDNDCLPTEDWIDRLLPHFADPLVAAVAPRMVAVAPGTWAGRYTAARCALDLGAQAGTVAPGRAVPYVPTAALVVRRAALPTGGFDPALRVGEDVDLVWRLCAADWRIRYEPTVSMHHQEPTTWRALLARRWRYGTSVAPLARRHPKDLPPLITSRWIAGACVALLAGRPALAVVPLAVHVTNSVRGLRAVGVPWRLAVRVTLGSVGQAGLGIGRYGTQLAAPLLLALAVLSTNRTRRLAAVVLLLGPSLADWCARRPRLDPVRYVLAHLADELAYGLGVLSGCRRERTAVPLCPVIT